MTKDQIHVCSSVTDHWDILKPDFVGVGVLAYRPSTATCTDEPPQIRILLLTMTRTRIQLFILMRIAIRIRIQLTKMMSSHAYPDPKFHRFAPYSHICDKGANFRVYMYEQFCTWFKRLSKGPHYKLADQPKNNQMNLTVIF
jgi:hypothetical protein